MQTAQLSVAQRTESLYFEHYDWLLNRLVKRAGCQHLASDLIQDVFVRLLGRETLPELPQPRAYLAKIAHGLLIDQHRRKLIEQAWLSSMAHLPEDLAPSPEEQVLVIDALSRIDALLNGLKPRVRQAFLMSRLEGMTYPAIADELGVSLSTVEKDIAKALRHSFTVLLG